MKNKLLSQPDAKKIKQTSLYKFIEHVNKKYKLKLNNFDSLHLWSINNREDFWEEVWNFLM